MMLNTRGRMNSDFGFHYVMKKYQGFRWNIFCLQTNKFLKLILVKFDNETVFNREKYTYDKMRNKAGEGTRKKNI